MLAMKTLREIHDEEQHEALIQRMDTINAELDQELHRHERHNYWLAILALLAGLAGLIVVGMVVGYCVLMLYRTLLCL